MSTSANVVQFPFDGDELHVVPGEGQAHVILRRVCEALGLSYPAQLTKLKNDPSVCVAMIATQMPGDDQRREVACLDVRSLPLWLATVHPSKAKPGVREKLIRYRREAAEVLADHFLGKRAREPQARGMTPAEVLALVDERAVTLPEIEAAVRAVVREELGHAASRAPLPTRAEAAPAPAAAPNGPRTFPSDHVHEEKQRIAARLGICVKAASKLMDRPDDPLPVKWCRRRKKWIVTETDLAAWDARQPVPAGQAVLPEPVAPVSGERPEIGGATPLPAAAGPFRVHELFPCTGPEMRPIHWIAVQRKEPDGTVAYSDNFHRDELATWADVQARFGGGSYKVLARDRRSRAIAYCPSKTGAWITLPGESRPLKAA